MFAILLILGASRSPVKTSPQPTDRLDFLRQLSYSSISQLLLSAYGEPTPPFVGVISLVIGVNCPDLLCGITAAMR